MSLPPFRANDHPTLGVEIELALVDTRTMGLRNAIGEVLAGLPEQDAPRARSEFLQCYIEIDTPVCHDVVEVERALTRTIGSVEAVAARRGVGLFWGGTHPFSRWRDQAITPELRYFQLADEYQEVIRRPVTFGLHVHVGVASGDAAIDVMNRLVEHVPLLLALSSNSPLWQGRVTGLHSQRIGVLEGIPTGGLPPHLSGWAEYESLVESFTGVGFIHGPKELWWDVRPNAGFGTIEVRICDTPADLPSAVALAALIQCLVTEASMTSPRERRSEAQLLAIRQNRWRACRDGLSARLVDPDTSKVIPARDVARHAVDRLMTTAERLGCARALAHVASLANRPSGAERQLAQFTRTGDLVHTVRAMTAQSRLTSPRAPLEYAETPASIPSAGTSAGSALGLTHTRP